MNDDLLILEGQIRECYGRVVYSHKTHEKCADILINKHENIKIWQIVVSALVTGGIVSTFFDKGHISSFISVVLSTALLILNTYTKNYDFGELAQKHRQAGSDLWIIREEYLSLLTDIRIGDISIDKIREKRDRLAKELQSVYAGSPSTNYKAYIAAQKALQELEDMTFSDSEVDAFLPKELKRF